MLMKPFPNSVIANGRPLTGKKAIAFAKDFDLAGIKRYCKARKCTINDYATSLCLTAIYEYTTKYNKDGFEVPKMVNYVFPYSTREPIKELKDIVMKNEVTGVMMTVPVKKDIEEVIPEFNAIMKSTIGWCEQVVSENSAKFA